MATSGVEKRKRPSSAPSAKAEGSVAGERRLARPHLERRHANAPAVRLEPDGEIGARFRNRRRLEPEGLERSGGAGRTERPVERHRDLPAARYCRPPGASGAMSWTSARTSPESVDAIGSLSTKRPPA